MHELHMFICFLSYFGAWSTLFISQIYSMEYSSMNFLLNISFFVLHAKENHTGLEQNEGLNLNFFGWIVLLISSHRIKDFIQKTLPNSWRLKWVLRLETRYPLSRRLMLRCDHQFLLTTPTEAIAWPLAL